MHKTALNNPTLALLVEGVASATSHLHQIRQLADRAQRLADDPAVREAVYGAAGDILSILPEKLDTLEAVLARTALVLAKVGDDQLSQGMSFEDKSRIQDAWEPAKKVAQRWWVRQCR